ncbi:MAG: DNA (cytosine-5-)-methyltransferase [Verrucomicrobia bacterium]|nr:DNA (cytosine-5-)-methyltransferase [Verrucomicrobiota bacterium]
MRFVDLFSGLGGFHVALKRLGHKCVFACDIDPELRRLYELNFGLRSACDIREIHARDIPHHEVLCAGFPCQPYSKAGEQLGRRCPRWGDLFEHHVLRILKYHRPKFIVLENVANLQRHASGRTWRRITSALADAGYDFDARILSPHRFGVPQIRERLFLVGALHGLNGFEWPKEQTHPLGSISEFLEDKPTDAKALPPRVVKCLNVWQGFLKAAPPDKELPSFPIWSMEFGADYPFEETTPFAIGLRRLAKYRGCHGIDLADFRLSERMAHLPSYARTEESRFPEWKIRFIEQNRAFYRENRKWIDRWLPGILEFPPSWQKLEWNCKGETRNIWRYIIQFRASGVRVKRPTTAPSLVAMTSTQIPIIAKERRYMTRRECARLQSLGSLRHLPETATSACKAFGNAVNAEIVHLICRSLVGTSARTPSRVSHHSSHPEIARRAKGE